MNARPLAGLTVGITADRRADEQAQMLEHSGARVLHGPVLRTTPIEDDERARAATESLLRSPPDVVVANTGLGIRTWLALSDGWGLTGELIAVLDRAYVASRGPKAAGALLTVGIDVDWRAPSAVLAEVVDHIVARGVAGRRVALQLDGGDTRVAAARLHAAGAEIVEISTYAWSLPKDRAPALRLVDSACSGKVDALTFTAAPAVRNLFTIAEQAGRGDELRAALAGPVLAMCVGPVCREAALALGVPSARAGGMARLGGMVKALADELQGRCRAVEVGGVRAVVQGSLVTVGGVEVTLAARERALFDALSRRAGVVIPRRTLLDEVWGTADADPHALEVTVGRLRRRLGPTGLGVEAVIRRGYRLTSRRGLAVLGEDRQ